MDSTMSIKPNGQPTDNILFKCQFKTKFVDLVLDIWIRTFILKSFRDTKTWGTRLSSCKESTEEELKTDKKEEEEEGQQEEEEEEEAAPPRYHLLISVSWSFHKLTAVIDQLRRKGRRRWLVMISSYLSLHLVYIIYHYFLYRVRNKKWGGCAM